MVSSARRSVKQPLQQIRKDSGTFPEKIELQLDIGEEDAIVSVFLANLRQESVGYFQLDADDV